MSKTLSEDELSAFDELDKFALLACQKYNLGNDSDWFGLFRGGLYGFYARMHGLGVHYHALHSWFPPRYRSPTDTDYHLSSVFFNMDSATECFTFALNALGFAAFPEKFRNIVDSVQLRKIGPRDIIGNRQSAGSPAGYSEVFPRVQEYWQQEEQLIERIVELHDVSKHRQTIYYGGELSGETPPEYYEPLGIKPDDTGASLFKPHKEIYLKKDPKLPTAQQQQPDPKARDTLEDLAPRYDEFLRTSGSLALQDSRANIPLKHQEFREDNT